MNGAIWLERQDKTRTVPFEKIEMLVIRLYYLETRKKMQILTVKVEPETKKKLQKLAKRKGYKSISDVVRSALEEHLAKQRSEIIPSEELDALIKQARDMSNDQYERIASKVFRNKKTAAELVNEARGGA